MESVTYEFLNQRRSVDFKGKIVGHLVRDEVTFNNDQSVIDDFVTLARLPSTILTARDAAGQLAIGHKSKLLDGMSLELSVDNPTVITQVNRRDIIVPTWSVKMFAEQQAANPNPADLYALKFQMKANKDLWEFPVRLLIDEKEIFRSIPIALVPDLNDIVIPSRHRETVMNYLIRSTPHTAAGPTPIPVATTGEAAAAAASEAEDDHFDELVSHFLYGPTGRLYAPCTLLSQVADLTNVGTIRLKSTGSNPRFIDINPDQLRYYGKKNFDSISNISGDKKCVTRIVFSDEVDVIKFGLPFFASVESVLLDSRSHSVSIRMAKNRSQRSAAQLLVPQPVSFLPPRLVEYSLPTISQEGGNFQIEFSSEWGTSSQSVPAFTLLLENADVSMFDMTGEFVFVKKYKSVSGRVVRAEPSVSLVGDVFSIQTIAGLYHMPSLQAVISPDASTVHLNFVRATDPDTRTYTVELENSRYEYVVRIRLVDTIVLLENYHLQPAIEWPAPKEAQSTETAEEAESTDCDDLACSICQEEYLEGDQVQSLAPHCAHSYHVNCLRKWMERNRLCCLCRARVPFRPGARNIVSVSPPEDDEAGADQAEENEEGTHAEESVEEDAF